MERFHCSISSSVCYRYHDNRDKKTEREAKLSREALAVAPAHNKNVAVMDRAAGAQPRQASVPRVLVVDDQHLFRSGLVKLLENDTRIRIVGDADDGAEA